VRTIPPQRLAAMRAAAQLLHRPGGPKDPADVAGVICGAQAQELRAGRLSLRARRPGLTLARIDEARVAERSLVRTWAMRTTVHLIATEDFHWLVPLFAPANAAFNRRRLAHFGVSERDQRRGLKLIEGFLADEGPLTRPQLVERLAEKGIELAQEPRMHLLMLSVTSRMAVQGPDAGKQTCFALERDWLGEQPAHDRERSLAELARRYLGAFGPATEGDFAKWAGLGLRDVRAGLQAITGAVSENATGGDRLLALRQRGRAARRRVVRLLPAWDTYLMGYRDRAFMTPAERWREVAPGGGILRPSICIDGILAGRWNLERQGKRWRVQLEPFEDLDDEALALLEAEVAEVEAFENGGR
jgi:hypothetical protein